MLEQLRPEVAAIVREAVDAADPARLRALRELGLRSSELAQAENVFLAALVTPKADPPAEDQAPR